VSLGGAAVDGRERLLHLDRVLHEVRLEPVQPEADRLRAVPEERRPLERVVGEIGKLRQDAAVDLEQRVAHLANSAVQRLRRGVAVLLAPRSPARLPVRFVAWRIRRSGPLDRPEEATLRAEHVQNGLANWPRAIGRDLVEDDGEIRVQWCHGSPGIVASMAEHATPELDELLLAGGELVWLAGPPRADLKGAGLCHGTAGCGLAFLKLFRRTGDELWLDRARRFAMHALAEVDALPPRYSLWTGSVGAALFATRCIGGNADVPTIDSWD